MLTNTEESANKKMNHLHKRAVVAASQKGNYFVAFLAASIMSCMITTFEVLALVKTDFMYCTRFALFACGMTLIWLFASIAYFAVTRTYKSYTPASTLLFCAFFSILGICYANWIWNSGYLSLNPILELTSGSQHIDTLYNSAIAGSYASYGVPSVLVNDVVLLRYHTLSNLILGGFSVLLSVPSYFAYNYVYPVLVLPLHVFWIILACSRAKTFFCNSRSFSVFDAVVVCVFLAGWLPSAVSDDLGIFQSSRIISESYAVAIVLLMMYLFFAMGCRDGSECRRRFFLLIVNPVAIILCCYAKISVGALLTAGIVLYQLYLHYKQPKYWLLQLLNLSAFVLAWFLFCKTVGVNTNSSFDLFYYAEHFVVGGKASIIFHFALVYLIPAVAVWWRFRSAPREDGMRQFALSKKYVYEHILIALCILSALPEIFISTMASSAYYFFDVPAFIAIVILVGYDFPSESWLKSKQLPANRCLAIIVAGCLMATLVINAHPKAYFGSYLATLSDISSGTQSTFFQNIESIDELTKGKKDKYAIFFDDSAEVFKKYAGRPEVAFVYPAATNLLCVNEIYHQDGSFYDRSGQVIAPDTWTYYGFPTITKEPRKDLDEVIAELPEGIEHIIVMRGNTFEVL